MKEDKKVTIISFVIVVVLVLLIIGGAYAMFSFSASGQLENEINSGVVAISYKDKTLISVSNQTPLSDKEGMAREENTMEFSIDANIAGVISVGFDLGFTDIVEGAHLTSQYIKFVLYQGDQLVVGSPEAGVTIDSTKDVKGNFLQDHVILSGTFSTTESRNYKLVAWISDQYADNLTVTSGKTHSVNVVGETFKFKIQLKAGQIFS